MKVCVVDPSLFTLPYDQHLCPGLVAAGMETSLCGRPLRQGEEAYPHDYRFDRRYYRLAEGLLRRRGGRPARWVKAAEHPFSLAGVHAWMVRQRFDVFHFQWSPVPMVDAWHWRLLRRMGTVVFTVHDTEPFLGSSTSRWQRTGWRRLLDVPHGLIVHTMKSRSDLARLGISPGRIAIIPHGVLTPIHAGGPGTAPAPGPAARRTLLVFGEIKPYKGIDVLLAAAARLPEDAARGWRIVIAGRPRMDPRGLAELARHANLPVELSFGYMPDAELAARLDAADAVAFPYRNIDASGALMLSLSRAVPVIASDIGCFSELLEDGRTALLVRPGDEPGLAAAMARLFTDDDLRQRMRRNLRELVATRLSWAEIGRAHRRYYERLTANRLRPTADRRREPTPST